MSGPVGSEGYFSALWHRINEHGLDAGTYRDIAVGFSHVSERCSAHLLLSILRPFMDYPESPLYVNEIRSFLRENDKTLHETYGRLFAGVPGCEEVFGIESSGGPALWPAVAPPSAPQEDRTARNGAAKPFSRQRKRRPKNSIKKQAKAAAVSRHLHQVEKRAEKKQRRAEFERLARRENGG